MKSAHERKHPKNTEPCAATYGAAAQLARFYPVTMYE
jgi:hypothetical protein